MKTSVAAVLFAGLLFAAVAAAQPSFEVASIRVNISGDRSTFTRRGGESLALQNWPLRNIVLKAYGLQNYALKAPDWLASRNFDINAKAPEKVTESELCQMLRSLLNDRFQMKSHYELKEFRAYVLLPAKGGLKLKPVYDDGVFGVDVSRFPDKTGVACRHCTMGKFADLLADQMNLAVVDRSGIPDEYSFKLEWSPNQNADDAAPSIFAALNEQLGMRLETRRVPIRVLVVDSINQAPSEN